MRKSGAVELTGDVPVASADQLGEHRFVNVLKFVHVKAAGPGLMLPQPGQQLRSLRPVGEAIEGQARLPGREADRRSVAFPAGLILVVLPPEPHDGGPPHFRFFAGNPGHQFQEPQAITAPNRMFHTGQELVHGRPRCPGFVFSHGGSLAGQPGLVSHAGKR